MEKTIVIAGGNGYLGRILQEHLVSAGYRIVVLSRRATAERNGVRTLQWDAETAGPWTASLNGATALINLVGRTVNCRYNEKNKQEIYQSRLRSTKVLGEAIRDCNNPPPVWLNSSSATIYRYAEDRPMDEATGEIGSGFSVDVCLKWEAMLNAADTPRTRKVALRSAMVFGKGSGGVFEAFHRIVRLGLGGTLGSGRQYVSWVHATDFARIALYLLEHEELQGAVNVASPNPLVNREFMRIFRKGCHQPIGLPATAWMLEIGAFFLKTETELLLKSRRVVPGRLLDSGFQFTFPEWEGALSNIVG